MVNRVVKFTWDEWKWLAVIVMLGVVMYWTAIVVEPTYTLIREAQETQDIIVENGEVALQQNRLIIEHQDNNTKRIEDIIKSQGDIMNNQLILVKNLGNTTTKLGIVVDFFRNNFNETFLNDEWIERESTKDILGNVTQIRNILLLQEVRPNQTVLDVLIEKGMRDWIAELKYNLSSPRLHGDG